MEKDFPQFTLRELEVKIHRMVNQLDEDTGEPNPKHRYDPDTPVMWYLETIEYGCSLQEANGELIPTDMEWSKSWEWHGDEVWKQICLWIHSDLTDDIRRIRGIPHPKPKVVEDQFTSDEEFLKEIQGLEEEA